MPKVDRRTAPTEPYTYYVKRAVGKYRRWHTVRVVTNEYVLTMCGQVFHRIDNYQIDKQPPLLCARCAGCQSASGNKE